MHIAIKQAMPPLNAIIATAVLVCLIYAAFFSLSSFMGPKAIEAMEARMAAQSILFDPPASSSAKNQLKQQDMAPPVQEEKQEDIALFEQIEGEKGSLPPAPFDGLVEETNYGALPVIGKNKLKPFDAYKKPIVLDKTKPMIAIGVSGVGLSDQLYEGVFKRLTPQVSIILSPYVFGIDDVKKDARKHGYEVWLSLPIQNKNFPNYDPGSKGILVNSGLKFNQSNYKGVLALTNGYAGIAAYTDSAFNDAKPMLNGILGDAFTRGLGFFEMNSGRDSLSRKVAVSSRAAYIKNSLRHSDQDIEQRFTSFKRLAKRNGSVTTVLNVSPAMLDGFQKEVIKAQKEGFQIVPLSALADRF